MKRLLLPILILTLSGVAAGQDGEERTARITRISKLSATTAGDRGTFTVSGVETLNRNQLSFGAGWNNFDRTPQNLDINVAPVFVSYGLTGRINVTATFETQKQVAARNLTQTGFFNTLPFVDRRFADGFGDTIISAKYRLQRRGDNVGGISVGGFVKVPTADEEKGLGTGKVDGGIDLIFSSLLPLNFVLHSTMGLVATSDAETPTPIRLQDELRSGIGVAWPASGIALGSGSVLQGIFEYSTVTFIGAGSPNDAVQAPSDIGGGLRFILLDRGIAINAGYRRNTNFDTDFPGNDEYDGFVFGLSYTQPVEEAIRNSFPLVVLDVGSDEVAVGDSLEITASAYDADNDPLTYSWTSSGGQVVGTGETVRFDATGLEPGTYTVRAMVTDGRGGTSQSEVAITVRR